MIETHHDDGQAIHTLRDERGEMAGVIVIDSTVNGRARGGLRLAADLSVEEIRAAAHAMTLKYGLLGLPQGGAKGGVVGDADAPQDQRRQRLALFARLAEPLLRRRLYVPDSDMGTRSEDIRWMMRSVGHAVGRREWRGGRSGYYTAVSTMAAAQVICERSGIGLRGAAVAVEGFGSVGSALAELMVRRGGRVVAISTSRGALYRAQGLDIGRLTALAGEVGSAVVEGLHVTRMAHDRPGLARWTAQHGGAFALGHGVAWAYDGHGSEPAATALISLRGLGRREWPWKRCRFAYDTSSRRSWEPRRPAT